jgi:hypothetical protein
MTSLIQLRQRIEGERTKAIVFAVFGGVSIAISVVSSVMTQHLSAAGLAGIGLVFVVTGLVRARSAARRDLATFEAEHGVGAGKQQSIR